MAAIVINGNAIAAAVRREWKGRAEALKRRGVLPALAVVIAGDNLASKIYVRNKVKACCEVGLHSEVIKLPTDIGEDMVLAHIRRLNRNPDIHGILVQLPLPPQFNRDKVLATVSADKDVDGLHAHNLGSLLTNRERIVPAVHAIRHTVSSRSHADPYRGPECGGGRTRYYRRQADGPDAPSKGRHGHHLHLKDQ